jgi:hypothetical protein
MAAGLGFKTFNTGEILSAADTNGYLMQGVLVFANATARDAAITSPQEGQFAYLKDTNVTTYYTGSAWANLDTTGMTNPMTTTGDTIYSSSGSTPARLGIGTSGQVLTVSGGGVPSWATPAGGGGKVLQVVEGVLTAQISTTSNSFADTGLTVSITPSSATSKVLVFATMTSVAKWDNDSGNAIVFKLLRGATDIFLGGGYNAFTGSASKNNIGSVVLQKLDSPATTSATTYKVQWKSATSGGESYANLPGGESNTQVSTIIAMEIGA